jgi:DNA-binding CsgD family transcriptional regulator
MTLPLVAPTLPALRPLGDARESPDPLERLMASGLDWIALSVPAAVAVFCVVDRRLNVLTNGPIVTRLDPSRSGALEEARVEYLDRHRHEDPFAPRRWAYSAASVVGVRDVGGPALLAGSPYGAFLARHGFGAPTLMYLRNDGRIVAAVVLLRDAWEPEIGAREIRRLRRCHPLLEHAYAVARHRVRRPNPADVLRSGGLTSREIDVARLAAGGASNDEIARALVVTVPTVKTHMTHLLAKLGLRSRTELVVSLGAHTKG